MSPSMKDVARLANVSTATVSNVLNGTRYVNPETKQKVLQAVKDLNYIINPVARNLRSGSSRTIGLVVSDLANFFYMDIALSIDKVLEPEGYHLIFINSDENEEKEKRNIESLLRQNVDGLIIAPVAQDCSYMNELIGERCPSVFFDRRPGGFNRDYILSSNFEGAFEGTEVLLTRNHANIGFIGSSFNETMNERANGFRFALKRHGLTPDEELIKFGDNVSLSLKEQKGGACYELTRQLVEEHSVTAILCGNDLSAVGVMNFLKEHSYSIPDSIAIASFDDMFWLSMATPSITAIDQDRTAIGKTAAEVLLKRMHENREPYKEYRIPTTLITRESC